VDGQLVEFGDTVPFRFDVTDPEDGSTNCARAKLTYVLGHDSHGHQITSVDGCSGEITIPVDGEHDDAANIFGIFDAQYTDEGGLITHQQIKLQPRHRQAEHFTTQSGVGLIDKSQAEGGRTVGNIDNGDWVAFERYNLSGVTSFRARVSSGGAGGTLHLRSGSATGPVLGSATVPVTGSWETFIDVTGTISNPPAATTTLYLTFSGGSGALFDVDSFTFPEPAIADTTNVLVFSKTAGFRHDSIPAGIAAIREMGFDVTATEDAGAFTEANLAQYAAVVFLSTTGDVLNATQQAAFEAYIRAGGGFAGIHAAADTEYDWPFYGNLVGAYFLQHPAIQQANVRVEDRAHAATSHLPQTWTRTDEWYDYRTNPRSTAHILANLDEGSYSGGVMGADHPIAWCKTYEGGRSFYTGGGHTQESYADQAFRTHLQGGIRYAAGLVQADCRPETGYTTLYNGSTTGWSQAGPGSFTNTDATLTSTGGMGLYWYQAKQLTDYSLKLDWKLAGDDNTGVFIGFPPSDDPWSAVNNGYEIQIDATDEADRTTGAVYTFKSADIAARDAALNRPGQWNTYELLVEGERLQLFLNGTKINDFTNTDPARSLAGHIGIQNHGDGDDASFRNIRIKELGGGPAPTSGPIVGLANKCLDVANAGTADGTKIQLYTCSQSAAQTWTRDGTSFRALGKCLDVDGGNVADGTKVQLWTCNNSGAQSWTPQADGTIVNPQSGKCLDVSENNPADGQQIHIWTCHTGANQQWRVFQ
jgi:type 1 glutamine amidotransferase